MIVPVIANATINVAKAGIAPGMVSMGYVVAKKLPQLTRVLNKLTGVDLDLGVKSVRENHQETVVLTSVSDTLKDADFKKLRFPFVSGEEIGSLRKEYELLRQSPDATPNSFMSAIYDAIHVDTFSQRIGHNEAKYIRAQAKYLFPEELQKYTGLYDNRRPICSVSENNISAFIERTESLRIPLTSNEPQI